MGQSNVVATCSMLNNMCCECERNTKVDEMYEQNFTNEAKKHQENPKERPATRTLTRQNNEQVRVMINTYSNSSLKLPTPKNQNWLSSKLSNFDTTNQTRSMSSLQSGPLQLKSLKKTQSGMSGLQQFEMLAKGTSEEQLKTERATLVMPNCQSQLHMSILKPSRSHFDIRPPASSRSLTATNIPRSGSTNYSSDEEESNNHTTLAQKLLKYQIAAIIKVDPIDRDISRVLDKFCRQKLFNYN